ncbi:MAG: hypothetical protein ICV60_15015 [Pyrinomonadaceae bacterium]|nr:hypothetical protein [Pyrinomonadaceae bacterium]
MITYGVGYKLEHVNSDKQELQDGFKITFTYVVSFDERDGFVRLPRTYHFALPSVDGFILERLGASETRGLFGGVENQRQKLYSEACERAIGEVLTITLCEILGAGESDKPTSVIIFGPALPKVVGRFAHLRPPVNYNILWVCPKPFPEWIAERANEVLLFPPYSSSVNDTEGWEDEPLVVSFEYTPPDSNTPSVVQHLQMWPDTQRVDDRLLSGYAWAEAKFANRAFLPREIPIAAGQVQHHQDNPFEGGREEKWRTVKKDYKPLGFEVEGGGQLRSGSPRIGVDGWSIKWNKSKNKQAAEETKV